MRTLVVKPVACLDCVRGQVGYHVHHACMPNPGPRSQHCSQLQRYRTNEATLAVFATCNSVHNIQDQSRTPHHAAPRIPSPLDTSRRMHQLPHHIPSPTTGPTLRATRCCPCQQHATLNTDYIPTILPPCAQAAFSTTASTQACCCLSPTTREGACASHASARCRRVAPGPARGRV